MHRQPSLLLYLQVGRGWHGHHLIDLMMDSRRGDAIAVNDGEGSSAFFAMVVFVGFVVLVDWIRFLAHAPCIDTHARMLS